jgi:uncharacterized protein
MKSAPSDESPLHAWCHKRGRVVVTATLLVMLALGFAFTRLSLSEDLEGMLPEKPVDLAEDFRYLQMAPFARNIVLSIERPEGASLEQLLAGVDRLRDALSPPLFTRAVAGPDSDAGTEWLLWLPEHTALLADDADLARLVEGLEPERVAERLEEQYDLLMSPEGVALSKLVRADPLGWREAILPKLRHVNVFPNVRIESGHFVSADRRHALLIAETPVSPTDFEVGRDLVKALEAAIEENVPAGFGVAMLSAHRYSVANAETAQRDLVVVVSASLVGMALLFPFFLRSWRGVFVFLLPVFSLLAAAVVTGQISSPVSAITIGFGAVLMGISVDFGLHIYFALRHGRYSPGQVVTILTRPLLVCGLTTVAAFGVLLFSALPGQRELAVFSIVGLATATLLALSVLPLLIEPGPEGAGGWLSIRIPNGRGTVKLGLWLAVLVASVVSASRIEFSGDLRSLSVTPERARQDEEAIAEVWGAMRERTLLFAGGETLESALQSNDRLFSLLQGRPGADEVVSLAPVLPSQETQRRRQERWAALWTRERTEHLRETVAAAAVASGFAANAFSGFLDRVDQAPAVFASGELRDVGFGEMLDALLVEDGERSFVVSMVPSEGGVSPLPGELADSVRVISQPRLRRQLRHAVRQSFSRFLAGALLAVAALLTLCLRSWRQVVVSMIPSLTGIAFMLGAMSALGLPLNVFNLVAAILVVGVGVDYGLLMVHQLSTGHSLPTRQAVLVSGLTTLVGFGVLAFARHPALNAIGTSVALGLIATLLSALLVVPAVASRWSLSPPPGRRA